jgi:alpha-1,3-mannosyl-glycoprotein beta-1,2-N-acetylglucosaminyltransferase
VAEPLPVLILACDRPAYLARALGCVLGNDDEVGRRIIVSQHGADAGVHAVIHQQGARVEHLQFRDRLGDLAPFRPWYRPLHGLSELLKWRGHYRIARHYGWAFQQVFDVLGLDRVIVLEDDLEIAPDFFSLFRACSPLLDRDPSLLTVSAWNDNGREGLVADPRRLYRTDFFPGLGWLMTKRWWQVMKPGWPAVFWDDWVRGFACRRGLASIYPEVCRTYTFGETGVSAGENFDRYLQTIALNRSPVDFDAMDLRGLVKESYDPAFEAEVARASFVAADRALAAEASGDVKVVYSGAAEFAALAQRFGLMPDIRSTLPRTSYHGIVAFRAGARRVFLVPVAYLAARTQPVGSALDDNISVPPPAAQNRSMRNG